MTGRLVVQRTLTRTPLAREHHDQVTRRAGRPLVPIPWSRFDRSRYSAEALALAYDAQTKLALGEYVAVDGFARLASALALRGAPFDIVAAAARIPSDEIRHADYALRMAGLLAGRDPETIRLSMPRPPGAGQAAAALSDEALDLLMIEVPAIGETLAAALLMACRQRASDPVVRAQLTSIVGDEVHHCRLGWYYLAWRAPQWTLPQRQRLADRIGAQVIKLEQRFSRGRDAPAGSRKMARALGVLDTAGQRRVVRQVMEKEIVPALDALGLGASHAWHARPPLE
jgi:hypothetical protein